MIVYKSENKVNGTVYIGKTINNINHRRLSHICKSKNGSNTFFHNAIRKYGSDNFEWSILAETDNESKLNALEKFYIMMYRKMGAIYNLTDGGEGASGWRHTDIIRKKMSESHIGKCSFCNNSFYGRTHSEETKMKMSDMKKNISEETKKKMSESKKGRRISEDTKNKMRGRTPWNKGLSTPEDVRIKQREAHKNISDETRKKMSDAKKMNIGDKNPFYGKRHSEESKMKMSKTKELSRLNRTNANMNREFAMIKIKEVNKWQ